MKQKKGFIVHDNAYELIALLTLEERGKLFTALFDYHRESKEPQGFAPLTQAVFIAMRQAIDQDRIAYEKRCAANRANGKLGGRPPKKESQKPKKPDMDMDMEMDMDMDMDMEVDMDMDMDMDMEGQRPSDPSAFPRSADGSASLSEPQKEALKNLGVPASYWETRQERALRLADANREDPVLVLLRWWKQDQKRKKPPSKPSSLKSYDSDEFFEAAMNRFLSG